MNPPVTELNHRVLHRSNRLSIFSRCLLPVAFWLALGILMLHAAGCQPIIAPETPPAAQPQGLAAMGAQSSSAAAEESATPTPAVESAAILTATPTASITALPSEVSEELVAGNFPPDSQVIMQESSYMVAVSRVTMEEAERFFIESTADMHLLERLWAPVNQHGGQSLFLLFWQDSAEDDAPPSSDCVYASTESAHPGVTIMRRGECSETRGVAENWRSTPWERPKDVKWVTWEQEGVSFIHPDHWQIDKESFAMPTCQQPHVTCLAALIYTNERSMERFSVIVLPREENLEPFDYAVSEYEEHLRRPAGYELLASFPIRLYAGQEAYQSIYLYHTSDGTPVVQFSIHAVSDTKYYAIIGGAINGTNDLSGSYAAVNAAAHSFRIKSQP